MRQAKALFLSAVSTALLLVVVANTSQVLGSLAARLDQRVLPSDVPVSLAIRVDSSSEIDPLPQFTLALTSEQAASIASNIAPQAVLLKSPELVNLEGVMAYEAIFDQGKVYIDAKSGEVLYSDVQVILPTVTPTPGQEDAASITDDDSVTIVQAIEIASEYLQESDDPAEVVGGRIRTAQGLRLFEITFTNAARVYVSAQTGEIISVQMPDD